MLPVVVMLLGAVDPQYVPSNREFSVPPSLTSTYSDVQLKKQVRIVINTLGAFLNADLLSGTLFYL